MPKVVNGQAPRYPSLTIQGAVYKTKEEIETAIEAGRLIIEGKIVWSV